MRLFIAFDIPGEYSGLLSSAQKFIKAKASFPKLFHLTLKFIGEVEEKDTLRLIEQLKKVKFKKFDANFSGIGCFPNDKSPRVVWLALEPKDILTDIAKQIETQTAGFGIAQDKTFIPHITLARIKNIENITSFQDSLNNISIPTESFELSEFKLIKSKLTPEGPEYDVLTTFGAQQ